MDNATIETARFKDKCRFIKGRAGNGMLCDIGAVSAADLPADVADNLRSAGLADWFPDGEIQLGEATYTDIACGTQWVTVPVVQPSYPVGEITKRTKATLTPGQAAAYQREAAELQERQRAEQRAEEQRKIAERHAFEAERQEQQRRQDPGYLARQLERRIEGLERRIVALEARPA